MPAPYRSTLDKDSNADSLRERALQADEFVHPAEVDILNDAGMVEVTTHYYLKVGRLKVIMSD